MADTQQTSETPAATFESSKLFRYSIGMFTEARLNGLPQFSIGRTLLAVLVAVNLYFWLWLGKEAPGSLATLTLTIAGYVIGSKTMDTAKTVAGTVAGAISTWKSGSKKAPELPDTLPPPKTFDDNSK
jgi:hypothetical protein